MNRLKLLKNQLEKATGKNRIRILNDLAAVYFDIDPHRSLVYSKEAFDLLEQTDDTCCRMDNFYNLGIGHYLIGKLDEAWNYQKETKKLAHENKDEFMLAKANSGFGQICMRDSKYRNAIDYFKKALRIYQKLDKQASISSMLLNLGNAYSNLGQREKAVMLILESSEIKEQLGDKSGVAKALNNIGTIYYNLKMYEKSLDYYIKSLEINKEIGADRMLISSYTNVGNLCIHMEKYEKALNYLMKALEIGNKIDDRRLRGYTLCNIGLAYSKLGKYKDAFDHFNLSIKFAQENNDKFGLSYFKQDFGSCLIEVGDYDKAIELISESLVFALDHQQKDQAKNAYKYLSEAYRAKGCFEEALDTFTEYTHIKDEIVTQKMITDIEELNAKYESERKLKEAEIYRLKNIELAEANATIKSKNEQLSEAYRKMELLARTDPLTKLFNRRYLIEQIKEIPLNEQFCILIADIDDFKLVNDSYGHDSGDIVLFEVSRVLEDCFSKNAICSRWGGEEFIVLVKKTSMDDMVAKSESFRQRIATKPFSISSIAIRITLSIGICCRMNGEEPNHIINNADKAMYRAKNTGKNKLEIF